MTTRILIVDDHQIVREGVRSLLNTARPEWELSQAADGTQAVVAIWGGNPDLVIMDITMPGLSGFEVIAKLRSEGFDRPILIFTMHKSKQLGKDARNAGAQGYVLKSEAVEDLVRAIDMLLGGGTFYGSPVDPSPDSNNSRGQFLFRLALKPVFSF